MKVVTSKALWEDEVDIYKLIDEFKRLGFDLDGRVCGDGVVELVIRSLERSNLKLSSET